MALRLAQVGEMLPARGGLYFRATANGGQRVPIGYEVQWRITNTGAVTMAKGAGRGGFEIENRSGGRWEGPRSAGS